MAKLRKMLGKADSPYIISLMEKIETQSKVTLANWCIGYAKETLIPLYKKSFPDMRPLQALEAEEALLQGQMKVSEVKVALRAAEAAAREAESSPVAQAAARGISQAAGVMITPTHALGMVFYATAAVAYDRVGLAESAETYDKIAQQEGERLLKLLHSIAVEQEENPVKINWNC